MHDHAHQKSSEQSDNSHLLKVFWRTIWKLPLPRKINVLAWKLGYQGALPTGKAKHVHHLQGNTVCPICNFSFEDDAHVFSQCWWASSIWNLSHIPSLADLLFYCYQHMSKPNLCRVIVSCWYIWFHRITCASNGMVQDPRTAMFRISSLLSVYQSNNSALLHGPHSHLFDWCRPPEQFIKVKLRCFMES
ncbi:hypothetical protein QQ045_012986 [Rhodiola kirilowii]